MAENIRNEESGREEIGREELGSGRLSNMGVALKDGIVASLRGINEIETEVVGVARTAVTDTLGATGAIATEGLGVARNILTGASEVGVDLMSVAGQTAAGAAQVIGDVGKIAARSLTDILVGVSGGAREVLGALLRGPERGAAEPAEAPANEEETATA